MCERIGIGDLAGCDFPDMGCGVRFGEAFLDLGRPVGSYTGIDVHKPAIDFLKHGGRFSVVDPNPRELPIM